MNSGFVKRDAARQIASADVLTLLRGINDLDGDGVDGRPGETAARTLIAAPPLQVNVWVLRDVQPPESSGETN
jgi:hypothetical protein